MTIALVPQFRQAWKWFSMWMTVVVAFLVGLQPVLDSMNTMPALESLTHSTGYKIVTMLCTLSIIGLRLIHQPNTARPLPSPTPGLTVTTLPVATLPVIPDPSLKGLMMNMNFTSLFNFALRAIIGMQRVSAALPTPMTGEQKKAAVVAVAQASIDPNDTSTVGTLLSMIGPIVEMLKSIHPSFVNPPSVVSVPTIVPQQPAYINNPGINPGVAAVA